MRKRVERETKTFRYCNAKRMAMDQAVCLEIKFRSRSFFPERTSRGFTSEILKTLGMFSVSMKVLSRDLLSLEDI